MSQIITIPNPAMKLRRTKKKWNLDLNAWGQRKSNFPTRLINVEYKRLTLIWATGKRFYQKTFFSIFKKSRTRYLLADLQSLERDVFTSFCVLTTRFCVLDIMKKGKSISNRLSIMCPISRTTFPTIFSVSILSKPNIDELFLWVIRTLFFPI